MKKCKAKECKAKECGKEFIPVRPLQQVCSPACALRYSAMKGARKQAQDAKVKRKEYKDAKVKAKTLTEWKDEAQAVFNRYIRRRDGNKCISCGTQNPNIQYAAGHYRTVKAAGQLRYNEDNVHTQCNFRCNSQMSGNLATYRPALIDKIGLERVEALENDNSEHRYTVDELKAIKAKYAKLARDLMKKQHITIAE